MVHIQKYIKILAYLMYNKKVIGYRIEYKSDVQGVVEYDVDFDTFKEVSRSINAYILMASEWRVPKVELVSEGNLLVPKGLKEAKELNVEGLKKVLKECEITNVKILSDYKNSTDVKLLELFDKFNAKYFNNMIRPDIRFYWSTRMSSSAGYYIFQPITSLKGVEYGYVPRIKLSKQYHDKYGYEEVQVTLLHEMIHSLYLEEIHGNLFIRKMNELNTEYSLKISLHSKGRVSYNYVYMCTECSHTYKRTKCVTDYAICRCGGILRTIYSKKDKIDLRERYNYKD